MERRIIGGKIEASNDRNFANCKTFYEIGDMDYPDLISIESTAPYRYWRFKGGNDSWCNLAELQFYQTGSDSIARGRIIGTDDPWDEYGGLDKAFDGNWLTNYHYKYPDGGWVGLDFAQKVRVDKVRCVPRSDDNAIHYGDTYELKYYDKIGWVSLGIRKADDKVLPYDSIPRNSLLLLRNHSRGNQERIFTWEDNKQRWW